MLSTCWVCNLNRRFRFSLARGFGQHNSLDMPRSLRRHSSPTNSACLILDYARLGSYLAFSFFLYLFLSSFVFWVVTFCMLSPLLGEGVLLLAPFGFFTGASLVMVSPEEASIRDGGGLFPFMPTTTTIFGYIDGVPWSFAHLHIKHSRHTQFMHPLRL